MKKILFVLVLLATGAIGFAVYWNVTEYDREYEKFWNHVSLIDRQRLSTSSQYQWAVLQDLRKRQDDLLDICFDYRHMHSAIEMLEGLINELSELPRSRAAGHSRSARTYNQFAHHADTEYTS